MSQLIKRYQKIFGEQNTKKLLKTRQEKYIRINLSKNPKQTLQDLKQNRIQLEPTPVPNIFKIKKSFFNLSSSLENLSGKIYLQDLASALPITLIKPKNNLKILDMASSPGSKLTQLIDILTSKSLKFQITALEKEPKRIQKLINNLNKQQFLDQNIKIINQDTLTFKTEQKFDIILLDAPCSGNLTADKGWLKKRNLSGIQKQAALQKKLLKKAKQLLKPAGEIIYSTCSNEPEENEQNVLWAKKHLKLKPQKTNLKTTFQIKGCENLNTIRLFPPISKTQGFFISKLKR